MSLTLFFLCVEYLGFVMVRKRLFFGEQRRFIMTRKFLMLGFGTGVMAVLSIPFFQFLCIPLAVIGATRLGCEEEGLIPLRSATEGGLSSSGKKGPEIS